MQIKINGIDFEVTPVAGPLRAALLADPLIGQAIVRDVWEWDAVTRKGKALTPLVENRAAVLPNGIAFFVAKVGPGGVLVKNNPPSANMAKRFLKATGAKDMNGLMGALNRILELPRKVIPFEAFRPLDATASYRIRMVTEFVALQLQNASRNLTAYLYLPAQVGFHPEITAVPDQAAHDAAGVDIAKLRPGFIVPAQSRAVLGMRRAALSKAFEELQAEILAQGGADTATDQQKWRVARISAEWQILTPSPEAAAKPN